MNKDSENWQGYEWIAFSVTTVGALLASIQGSALIIALPSEVGIGLVKFPPLLVRHSLWPGSLGAAGWLYRFIVESSLGAMSDVDQAL